MKRKISLASRARVGVGGGVEGDRILDCNSLLSGIDLDRVCSKVGIVKDMDSYREVICDRLGISEVEYDYVVGFFKFCLNISLVFGNGFKLYRSVVQPDYKFMEYLDLVNSDDTLRIRNEFKMLRLYAEYMKKDYSVMVDDKLYKEFNSIFSNSRGRYRVDISNSYSRLYCGFRRKNIKKLKKNLVNGK